MVSWFRIFLLALAVAPFVYYLMCFYSVIEYFRTLRKLSWRDNQSTPPVSILKPVRGADEGAYQNFASFCQLNYPNYEIIFAASDPDDPVLPVIQKLQNDFPERSIRLIPCVASRGANNKVSNLCQLVREAKFDLVAISDSDVRVPRDYLREIVAPFADSRVGVVTTFFRGLAGKGLVSALNAIGMYTDSAPAALVARKIEGRMRFAFGWTMATTKNVLAAIGGFESMVNHHSDDFELGNRISRLGYRVELMRTPVWMAFPEETLREHLRHELRWAIGLRNVRPAGYLGMIFTHGLPWAILASLAAITAGWTSVAVVYLLGYLGLRLSLVWTIGSWGFGDVQVLRKLYLVPLRDALNFAIWVAGMFLEKIVWRGFSYRVKKGLLVPAHDRKLAH